MTTYIFRRILQAIPIMLLLSIFLFGVVRLMPGGPLAQAERNPDYYEEGKPYLDSLPARPRW